MSDRLASSTLSARSKANIRKLGLDSAGAASSPNLHGQLSPKLQASSPPLQSDSPPLFSVRQIEQEFENVSDQCVSGEVQHAQHAHVHYGHTHKISSTKKRVETVLAKQHDAAEGGGRRAALMEAGAHLWLAEELRAAASMLTGNKSNPRMCAERLDELCQALQAEACKQRWKGGDGAYGGEGGVAHASRAA